jgi:hypothetical protein
MPAWEFHRRQQKMSLTTSIFNNVLQSSGFTPEERLVREALQNSVDAHSKAAELPVSVRIERRTLVGDAKLSLMTALRLDDAPAERAALFELPAGNALTTSKDPDVPLSVLTIPSRGA